ncbi:MAG TPA: type I phosphomannose isomerase catalytic subunit [Pontiella sp.]
MTDLYPLKFEPVYKDYPWGNTRLPALFGRKAPEGIYAESWEVSTHPDGESVIVNGALAGKTLSSVITENGQAVLGTAVEGNDFPLLIKLIDAAQPLSVQVHPNNGNAEAVQGDPKTEMWYFLNEEPSDIYCGLNPGITREDFISAIEQESFEKILRVVRAEKGGAVYVPGGRVHAIGAGSLILEVQQNSNTTYRVYDWGRVGHDGQARELHIDKALQVIDFQDEADPRCVPVESEPGVQTICRSDFFLMDRLNGVTSAAGGADGSCFQVLFSADGDFIVEYAEDQQVLVNQGSCVLLPAALGNYTLQTPKPISILRIALPS